MFGFFAVISPMIWRLIWGTKEYADFMSAKALFLTKPSVVAIRQEGGPNGKPKTTAVGKEAKQMLGKVPGNIEANSSHERRRYCRLHSD